MLFKYSGEPVVQYRLTCFHVGLHRAESRWIIEPASIERNFRAVQERMAAAAERSGRRSAEITLIAVTKYVGLDSVRALQALGVTHFGENRVDKAREKISATAGEGLVWHMIGNIQRRKTKDVVGIFDRIDAVDRLSLAERIQTRCTEQDIHATVLVEVNVSGEQQKHGFAPEELPDALQALARMDRITVRGLMTMAPYAASDDAVRGIFQHLASLRSEYKLPDLSMGMSNDFELAIEAGATEVRVGSALFDSV